MKQKQRLVILDKATVVGVGPVVSLPDDGRGGFAISIAGAGNVSATVLLELSDDPAQGWNSDAGSTFTVSGSLNATEYLELIESWRYMRATVIAVSAGASVTVSTSEELTSGVGLVRSRGALVAGIANGVTGGIKSLLASDRVIPLLGSGSSAKTLSGAQKWFGSRIGASTVNDAGLFTTANYGGGIKIEAESDFDAVRLVWVNRGQQAINQCSALVGVTETSAMTPAGSAFHPVIGGSTYNAVASAGSVNGWRSVTWNGNSTVDIPAATTSAQFGISDWVPLSSISRADGGSRPLLLIRGQHDGAAQGNFATFSNAAISSLQTPVPAFRNRLIQLFTGTNLVSSVASVNGAASTNTFEIFPIFRYRTPAMSVMISGDSIEENWNTPSTTGGITSWGVRGCLDASTTKRPIAYMNMGATGKAFAEYWARTKEIINAGVIPDVLAIAPASINDTYSNIDRTVETWRSNALEILEFCRTKGVRYLVFIPLYPYNSLNSTQDGYRKAFNAFLSSVSSANQGCFCLSFSSLGNGGTPEQWAAAYSGGDGIHPNEAAVDGPMASEFSTLLATLT